MKRFKLDAVVCTPNDEDNSVQEQKLRHVLAQAGYVSDWIEMNQVGELQIKLTDGEKNALQMLLDSGDVSQKMKYSSELYGDLMSLINKGLAKKLKLNEHTHDFTITAKGKFFLQSIAQPNSLDKS